MYGPSPGCSLLPCFCSLSEKSDFFLSCNGTGPRAQPGSLAAYPGGRPGPPCSRGPWAAPWAGGRPPPAWPGGPRPLTPPRPGLSWRLSWRGSRPPGWGTADGPTACQVGGGREGTDTCPGPMGEGGRAVLTPSRDGRLLPEWLLASCSGPAQPGACALVVGTAAWGPAGCCRGHAGPLCLLMVGAGALPPGCSQHVGA